MYGRANAISRSYFGAVDEHTHVRSNTRRSGDMAHLTPAFPLPLPFAAAAPLPPAPPAPFPILTPPAGFATVLVVSVPVG